MVNTLINDKYILKILHLYQLKDSVVYNKHILVNLYVNSRIKSIKEKLKVIDRQVSLKYKCCETNDSNKCEMTGRQFPESNYDYTIGFPQ